MKTVFSSFGRTKFVSLSNDGFIGKSIQDYGEWSYGEVDLLAKLISADENVLEVGANIGGHSVFIARDVCASGTLYAFEPRRILFQMLCANLSINNLENVRCFQLAVGERAEVFFEGSLNTTRLCNAGAFTLKEIAGNKEKIQVIKLDDMMDDFMTLSLIKADIEGYELDLLNGAPRLIKRDRPILYIENDRIPKSEGLITKLFELSYDLWWHIVPLFRKNNFAGNTTNVFGNIHSFNLLCLPSERTLIRAKLEEIGISSTKLRPCKDAKIHPLTPEYWKDVAPVT
jgi:FkbM family methyltransferase